MTQHYLAWAGHMIAGAISGILIIWAYRALQRRSATLATVFAAGLLIRAFAGLALFVISYFNLPILSHFHTGDGFWNLAPDARVYYDTALAGVHATDPSVLFVVALSWWMSIVGAGPASPLLFNVLCYAAAIVALVFGLGSSRPGVKSGTLFATAVIAFSPVLILVTTQALKDTFFVVLQICCIAIVCGAISRYGTFAKRGRPAAALLGIVAGIGAIAAVRTYYAFVCWVALLAAAFASLIPWRTTQTSRVSARWLAILVAAWLGAAVGAGPNYPVYGNLIGRLTGVRIPYVTAFAEVSSPIIEGAEGTAMLARFRNAYVSSKGGTNLSQESALASIGSIVSDTAWGLVDVFVPMSALLATGLVTFEGGRGILAVTDLDTAFIDVTAILVVIMLWRRRTLIPRRLPQLSFVLALAATSALLLAYVVTNYGTLFRLRLLCVVPFWLTPMIALPMPARDTEHEIQSSSPAVERTSALSTE